MRIGPLDELDELPLPPPLPLVRFCGAPGCRRRARPALPGVPYGRGAALARGASARARRPAADVAAARDDYARARDSGRAKLAMALRRGTLERGRCRECGAREVVGVIADPADWRAVVWVCREHRQAELERRRDATAQRAADARQTAWYDERTRALAAIELLPPAERARLHALAARGPAGTQLSPGAPLYVMNLVRVYKLHDT